MLKIHQNEDGVVFVTVLILIMSMMALAVTVVNLQLNQATIAEREINHIRSKTVALGALMYVIGTGDVPPNGILTDTLDGVTFDTTYTITPGTGPNGTSTITINVSYD